MGTIRRKVRPPEAAGRQLVLPIVARARATKVARAVVGSFTRYGRPGGSLKEAARDTGYPLRTVQRAVRRLLETEEIIALSRGRYAVSSTYFDLTSDPLAKLGFQNLRFKITNWREEPVPPCRVARVWDVISGGDSGPRAVAEFPWEGRSVKLIWYQAARTLEVIVAARNPIPLGMAGELKGWLTSLLGLGQGETSQVTYWEVNADHRFLRWEEAYLELRDLPHTAHVLYRKGQEIRDEWRLALPTEPEDERKPLAVDKALELLVYGSPQARQERETIRQIELAKVQLEVERAKAAQVAPDAPTRTAPKSPSEAREAGFG